MRGKLDFAFIELIAYVFLAILLVVMVVSLLVMAPLEIIGTACLLAVLKVIHWYLTTPAKPKEKRKREVYDEALVLTLDQQDNLASNETLNELWAKDGGISVNAPRIERPTDTSFGTHWR